MAFIVIEPLEAHQQPSTFLDTDATAINDGAVQHDEAVGIRQVEMMGYGRMWLGVRAMKLKGGQICEEHRACMCVGGFGLGTRRETSRRMESPLQEMDVRSRSLAALKSLIRLFDIPAAILGHGAGKREDELWMRSGCAIYTFVCLERDDSAKRKRVIRVSKPP